jgi:ectoine hydroxylase-related dioxygenase (phytanoyl-CoA dioxygenase family)
MNISIELLKSKLDEDGVVVIPNIFTEDQIQKYRQEYNDIYNILMDKIKDMPHNTRDYITSFDKKINSRKKYWIYEGTPILEVAKGRYDFTWGMDKGVFSDSEYKEIPIVMELVRAGLKCDIKQYYGAISSLPDSDSGPWHRDTYPLFDNDEFGEITTRLPPFYYVLLIPLVEMDINNGTTEFIIGSHKKTYQETISENLEHVQMKVPIGSVILFDGRIYHRGRENLTQCDRATLVQGFTKIWYTD